MAAPSGLNVIPTADVLGKELVSLEYEVSGKARLWDGDCAGWGLFQIGIGHGLELGLDRCFSDDAWWGNVKWQALAETPRIPAVALGLQGLSKGARPQPYLATTRSIGKMRLHAGAILIGHNLRWMLGLDRPVGRRLTLQADYTSGDENALTYGMSAALTDNLALTLARTSGNSAAIGNGEVLNLAWTIKLD